jgi:hypothetical protein
VSDLAGDNATGFPFYVVVMVADDPSENDGNPYRDGATADNPGRGRLTVRAEAFGPGGSHKILEATIARLDASVGENAGQQDGGAGIARARSRVLSWRELR